MKTPEWLRSVRFTIETHRNMKVICCYFPYNPALKNHFKKEFPSAKWSRTKTCWYLPDKTIFRKRCGIALPEIGQSKEDMMFSENRIAYEKFRNALTQKAYSPNTIATYLNEFAQLLILLRQRPVHTLNAEQLNAYFLYCIKKLKHTENQVHSRINAVKSYFKLIENKPQIFDTVIRPKPQNALPKVLSKEEVSSLFHHTQNLKHLLMLKLAYGAGLRVSELVNLEIAHIDLFRFQIHIVSSKNKKDRYVNLPKSLTNLYHDYLRSYQPEAYLFEGQFGGKYTVRSIQAVFKNAMKKAGIQKSVGIHGLRHSYATHLLEAGTDMVLIQKLLGHNDIKTTEIYARVSRKTLGLVLSPLDSL